MVRFEDKTYEVKVGFKYDHFAYAVLEQERDRRLRLPREVRRLKVSQPF
jgi:hypothetical protein